MGITAGKKRKRGKKPPYIEKKGKNVGKSHRQNETRKRGSNPRGGGKGNI